MSNEMKSLIIGITGCIGSGKSAVRKIIQDAGFVCLSTDDIAKELMNNSIELKNKLIDCFGSNIYIQGVNINKELLASIVFGNSKESHESLLKLNQIVHPYVIDRMIEETDKLVEEGCPVIFIESALIFEAGLEDGFDYIIVVDSNEDIAIVRVMKRTGQTKEQILNRMNEQISREEKRKFADFLIENNGTINDLKKSVEFVLNILSKC
jgi:dephospho-CoA kinase